MRNQHRKAALNAGLVLSLLVGFSALPSVAQPTLYLPFPGGKTYRITQYPHDLNSPYMGYAMDIGMGLNDPIWASAGGVVRVAGSDGNPAPSVNGNQVIIDHGNDFCTQYNHLNWVNVRRGQTVARGHLLGGAGATGQAFGVHLHFNTIYCSNFTTRGRLSTYEYASFFLHQDITSKNSQGLPYGLKGAIGARWDADGGEAYYGRPTTAERCGLIQSGCYQVFEKGFIHWTSNTGAWGTRGAISRKWRAISSENGVLGYPIGPERCGLKDGGCYQTFQDGYIHWTPAHADAYYTTGAISDRWRALGSENGFLGYPWKDEVGGLKNGGVYQAFQGGTIHWSPTTGAHPTRGAIQRAWESQGFENGWLGYPTSGEYKDSAGNTVQNFQGGKIYWNSTRGAWF